MKKSILIVEDDLSIRQSLTDVLQDEGYTVLAAENGREGLKILNSTETLPGLVFLDLMMPVLNGSEFLIEQGKDPKIAGIPTVLFSADVRLSVKAESMGVVEYLKKPVDLDKIFELAEKYCG